MASKIAWAIIFAVTIFQSVQYDKEIRRLTEKEEKSETEKIIKRLQKIRTVTIVLSACSLLLLIGQFII